MLGRALKFIVLLPIRFYQLVVSPWFGPKCRYMPTCSNYAREAVEKHGILKGGLLGGLRLCRCHPIKFLGGGSGIDPVPEKFELFSRPSSDTKAHIKVKTNEKKI